MGEIPEALVRAIVLVVVEHGPRQSDEGIFHQLGHHCSLGSLIGGIVKRGDPKFEHQPATFALGKIVGVRVVGVGQPADPRLTAPDESPVAARSGRRENVVVLRVYPLERKVAVPFIQLGVVDVGTTRAVRIDGDFEDIPATVVHIPVVIAGFVEEVEPVQTMDPAHPHGDV